MYNPKVKNDPKFTFPFQCIWLKLNGSWPLKSENEDKGGLNSSCVPQKLYALLYTTWSWYVLMSVIITIGFQSAFLVNTFGDIAMTTENSCTTFMGVLNFVRLLHLRLNQKNFKEILQVFVKDIWISKNSYPHIEAFCERNMRTFRIMTILLTSLISMYCVLPLIQLLVLDLQPPNRLFPYKMIFPFDAQHGVMYPLTYLFTAYAGICVVTTLFAEDSIFGFFITYTCGQFRILHERLDTLISDAHSSVINNLGEEFAQPWHFESEYLKRLKEIARMHSKLIEFATLLENFFSPILIVNFLISSILICMVGFQLVTGKDMFVGDYVKFIVYITSSLSQLYVLCFNGDMLIQHSTQTAKHLYASDWEGDEFSGAIDETRLQQLSNWQLARLRALKKPKALRRHIPQYPANKEFRRNLEFMILCAQKPIRITAFKFSTVSLQSFTAILSTSMSYFTLLQSVYNKDKDQGA